MKLPKELIETRNNMIIHAPEAYPAGALEYGFDKGAQTVLDITYESLKRDYQGLIMDLECMAESLYISQKGRHLDALVEYPYQDSLQRLAYYKKKIQATLKRLGSK